MSRDIGEMLKSLFVVGPNASREDMEDASRGYGRLLHAAGLKAKQAAHVDRLTVTVGRSKLFTINVKFNVQLSCSI